MGSVRRGGGVVRSWAGLWLSGEEGPNTCLEVGLGKVIKVFMGGGLKGVMRKAGLEKGTIGLGADS